MATLALAGDTMLGRKVAEHLAANPADSLFSPAVVNACRGADGFVLNLECCVSERGERWPDPVKPFFFRAPPKAVDVLGLLGADAVTLANNHALDYGPAALADTLELLHAAGVATVGAGADLPAARSPAVVDVGGLRLGIIGAADHPADFAAAGDRPGIAFADLAGSVPGWLTDLVAQVAAEADAVLVTPHWGPNMVPAPVAHVRAAAPALLKAGATLVAGHSAHVFHGVRFDGAQAVLFDLGDFLDDYAVHPRLRNDLGLLWRVALEPGAVIDVAALPLALDYCHTRRADGAEAAWITERLAGACADLGTRVEPAADGWLRILPG